MEKYTTEPAKQRYGNHKKSFKKKLPWAEVVRVQGS